MQNFGQRSLGSTTMRLSSGISAKDQRRTRVFANASPRHRDIEKKCPRSIVAKKHRRYIVEQRRTICEHSVRYTEVKNVAAISATFPTCSYKHRRCLHGLFDVIISSMVWVIHGRCSPMFPNCPATHRRCYGDALLGVFYFFSAFSNTPTEQKSDLFFIHDLIRQPQGMWFHVKYLIFLYALHMWHYTIAMISSRRNHDNHDFVKISPLYIHM